MGDIRAGLGGAFVLLNPGPINVDARVREALADCPDQCHREPEYLTMQSRVRQQLVDVFGVADTHEVALLSGSGTAAMEAMISSVAGEGVLIIDNGVYGDRLARMATAHGIPHDVMKVDWFERPDPDQIVAALTDEIDTVAVVHHETTTGLVNDLPAIARAVHEAGRRLIIDSVSGLAGEPFEWDLIQPDAVCCTANKCVEGLPGISFVFVKKDTPLRERSLYLGIGNMLEKQRKGDTPFTPAIQVMAALEAALEVLAEETVSGRVKRYGETGDRIRADMDALGLERLVDPEFQSQTITTCRLPEGVTYEQVHDRMRASGYVVYAGQGELGKIAFRVANMGQIPAAALDAFKPSLAAALDLEA